MRRRSRFLRVLRFRMRYWGSWQVVHCFREPKVNMKMIKKFEARGNLGQNGRPKQRSVWSLTRLAQCEQKPCNSSGPHFSQTHFRISIISPELIYRSFIECPWHPRQEGETRHGPQVPRESLLSSRLRRCRWVYELLSLKERGSMVTLWGSRSSARLLI